MKIQNLQRTLLAIAAAGTLALAAGNAAAQNSTAVQLSPASTEVLQLAQAKVSDSTIVAYIQNSPTIYALNASQIVYLKQQGVSDVVLNTMLNQRNSVMASGAQPAPQQQNYSDASSSQTANATVQPTVTYVQSAPASSVYVIPDTQTYAYDASYYQPYYYPYYYGWPYVPVSLSFGFGWHGGWGGGHGGWGGGHGGWGGGHGGWGGGHHH